MQQSSSKFKQTNAFAMQYGIALGMWGILSMVIMALSLKVTSISLLSSIITFCSPLIAYILTVMFRKNVALPNEGFSFGRAFLFTFVMGFYASVWIALFVFIYLSYIDNGYIFNAYESLLSNQDYAGSLQQSGIIESVNASSISEMIDIMRNIPPANYAASIIYMSVLANPVISLVIAAICQRKPSFTD